MKRLIQLTLVGLLSLYTAAFSQVSSSKWQSQPIVIDGDGSDWGTLPRFFNAESNVKYEFRNDSQYVYFIVKSADRGTQMQLAMAGFSLKLKVKTSPPEKFSINFHPIKKGEMPQMNNVNGQTIKLVEKSETLAELIPKDTVSLDGFQFSNGKIISKNMDENSFCFAHSNQNRDQITYEIRVPLREIFGSNFNLENISTLSIQLQVVINDLSLKESTKMRDKMRGGLSGGVRVMGRGRVCEMGGGMSRGGGEIGGDEMGERPQIEERMPNESSFSRKSFSIDFKLVTVK